MTEKKNWKRLVAPGRLVPAILLLFCTLGILVAIGVYGFNSRLKEMFRLNRELQEENYVMSEFEYRLEGISYLWDRGRWGEAVGLFNQYYGQLKSREGLVKLPVFNSVQEELEFYLNQQNPRTGAFMNDAYPMCVYHGPTENVLKHIEKLSLQLGKPVRLKYRLAYLDRIDTPEKVVAFLEDVSSVGYLASMMPQTSFHLARDILSLARDEVHSRSDDADRLIEKHGLYHFSPEWKHAVLQWFYAAQDPETGLWGPKSASGKLLKLDLNNTSSIIKTFRDKEGNDIHEEFPLRYVGPLLTSTLKTLSEPPPSDDDLAWMHEWNLKSLKSLRMMTRYLWKDMSASDRERATGVFKWYIRTCCEKYYIPEEGAFSYYPGSEHASLDGMTSLFIYNEIGALSPEKQRQLWGSCEETVQGADVIAVSRLTPAKLRTIAANHGLNSFRFYPDSPDRDGLLSEARMVCYPTPTPVPDSIELVQGVRRFLATTDHGMGNWVSKAEVCERLQPVAIRKDVVVADGVSESKVHTLLGKTGECVIVGFDLLQVPRYRLVVRSR
ncbi:hypothetical protein [Pseudodesulfovibrio karagichevae]|uniref:Uncharacterized protein n=1 Tax=Pseudodesulfovibrio karagichevae TaxID=3239305 RepID=A0ABV4K4I4_9BACT